MTEDPIAAIRQRHEQATKGPWIVHRDHDGDGYETGFSRYELPSEHHRHISDFMLDADADFIAHAREDIPYLLSRVEALEARVARADALIAKWRAQRAHTYASENADIYRGFDRGCASCARELEYALSADGIDPPDAGRTPQ